MRCVNDPASETPDEALKRRLAGHPTAAGVAFGLTAAVLYTATNVFLRYPIVAETDPMWRGAIKEIPILVLIAPWMIVRAVRGQHVLLEPKAMVALLIGASLTQFGGNTLFLYSLDILGIALAVPLTLGAILVGGATFGRIFLGEPVTRRATTAIGVLLAAIALLGVGAYQVGGGGAAATEGVTPWQLTLGIAANLTAGFCFSTLGVSIRYGVRGEAPISTTTVIVGAMGVFGLGFVCLARFGPQELAQTDPHAAGMILLAGVCNAAAFLAITRTFQLIRVVYVNALNGSQAAMAAIAGIVIFHEPVAGATIAGVLLTILGLSVMCGKND